MKRSTIFSKENPQITDESTRGRRSSVGAAIHVRPSFLHRCRHPSEARGSSRADAGPHPREAGAHRGGVPVAAGSKEESPPPWGRRSRGRR